jgi:hypothetical protein
MIVGLAIYVGITLFRNNAIESKRSIITNELVNLASLAQQYYMRPQSLGGGNQSFSGWTVPRELGVTASGHYTAVVQPSNVEITGTGNEVVTGNDSVKVQVIVTATNYETNVIN